MLSLHALSSIRTPSRKLAHEKPYSSVIDVIMRFREFCATPCNILPLILLTSFFRAKVLLEVRVSEKKYRCKQNKAQKLYVEH